MADKTVTLGDTFGWAEVIEGLPATVELGESWVWSEAIGVFRGAGSEDDQFHAPIRGRVHEDSHSLGQVSKWDDPDE